MTQAEAYLDRLYNEWQHYEAELHELPDYHEGENDLVYALYSRLSEAAATRYYAAKYMMKLMKEDAKND